jgi:membrane-bound lytic murein transglycosylase D
VGAKNPPSSELTGKEHDQEQREHRVANNTQASCQRGPGADSVKNSTTLSQDEDLLQPLEQEISPGVPMSSEDSLSGQRSELCLAKDNVSLQKSRLKFQFALQQTETMSDFYDYYARDKKDVFQKWLKRAEKYLPYIHKVFQDQGLPDDLIFLPLAESAFNPWAYSPAGAAGLWQFMPNTARHYGLKVDWWVDERRDPYKATHAAASYLKKLHTQFDDWYLALAAYNAGEGTISRALKRSGTEDYFALTKQSRYLKRETCKYVHKMMAILCIVQNLRKLGFETIDWSTPNEPVSVAIPGGIDLRAFSHSLGLDWDEFRNWNPFFRRTVSPPDREMRISLPQEQIKAAKQYLQKNRTVRYAGCFRYTIRSGDSWWKLSRRYNIPIRTLKGFNKKSSNLLKPGQNVLIPGYQERAGGARAEMEGSRWPLEYRVQAGDTLCSIASRFKVAVSALRQRNNFYKDGRALQIGQTLKIPSGQDDQRDLRHHATHRANYRVQKGDTLWGISRRFGVSLQTLLHANKICREDRLNIGTMLYVPDMSYSASQLAKRRAKISHSKIVSYTVRKGDSVWDIARKFGVKTGQVLAWNNLSKNEHIHPGERLKIYIQ